MTTRRILCVDDDEDTRDFLTVLLGIADVEAVSATDVDEALRLMRSEKFSLYVLDGRAAGGAVLSLCERIREVDKDTPVVIFSGRGYQSDIDAGMLEGANAYLVKPDFSALVATVRRLLEADPGVPGAE